MSRVHVPNRTPARLAVYRHTIAAVLTLCMSVKTFGQQVAPSRDQDTRTQIPTFLRDAFVTVNIGAIDQPFSQQQLEPGFHAASVTVPPVAVRVVLLGREFNRFLSAQASYLRPVNYVAYGAIAGPDVTGHHVRVNFGALTVTGRAPVRESLSVYGELGLGLTSRTGFDVSRASVVRDAHYASVVAGAGLEHRINRMWALTTGVTYWPGRSAVSQPRTLFASGGVRYTMRPLPETRVEANRDSDYVFPAHLLQIEYSSGIGYAINEFVSKTVPVFWGGRAKVGFGVATHYDQNVFHTRKVFALDLGVSAGGYKTRQNSDRFYTLSVYPLLRWFVMRPAAADVYVVYSLAGPTYISKTVLDDLDTGHRFTFQDFIGAGILAGRARHLNVGVKLNHYSNGNIFTHNAAVMIPLTISVGYAF